MKLFPQSKSEHTEMPINRIESAINQLCAEIDGSQKRHAWRSLNDDELLFELIACILGSRVTYEIALAAALAIRNAGLLKSPMQRHSIYDYEDALTSILKQPLHQPHWAAVGKRYRFANTRAKYLARTVWEIYSTCCSIKSLLRSCPTAEKARRSIIEISVGAGPKQASLFLRNIGFTEDLAILDTHVLRFMHMFGLINKPTKTIPTLPAYVVHEANLRKYAQSSGWSLACLDQAIWIVMRVYLREIN